MAGGLAALLDDIAAIARVAAASVDDVSAAAGRASAKAVGVVIDDAAVTPRYVTGFDPSRELPIIRKIALGSFRNKLVFILPAALILSQFVPWIITPILMLGGTYLSFEGAHKVLEWVGLGHHDPEAAPVVEQGKQQEEKMVGSAIRTDFILSTEIMIIALNEVAAEGFLSRALILAVVAIGITVLVYGVVALIVKMDDIGMGLAKRESEGVQKIGRGLVKAMPIVLRVLSTVGVIAMLWVGGHILLVGMDDLGFHPIYAFVHHAEEVVAGWVPVLGGTVKWLTNTFFSAILGLVIGLVVVGVVSLVPHREQKAPAAGEQDQAAAASH
ncbi:MAG: DUF808 domain-containing protein [Ornithinimicrobium sp.]|uniref:DUF808 domain-containing protein n=1 Tax=Ornithinimicrobium sp. TaxID=1977084 RepID=UPI0026DFBA4F|nr:DUF808 domain-containing protein [Ornithinimicrobium sp.]MDO5740770.1 DUF808 domain-containing protein [Ornithinimicrobium sp.]